MNTVFLLTCVVLLLFSPHLGLVGKAMSRPMVPNAASYNTIGFDPKKNHEDDGSQKLQGDQPAGLENCMPKGFRPTSAPSRYINYEPLGTTLCSTNHRKDKP